MNRSSTILAIDQGTTNSKAILVTESGEIVAQGSSPLTQSFPEPGWVEQDPRDIWLSVERAIEACLADARKRKLYPDSIRALGVTNQRETVTVWDRRSGQPLGPAIGWQCLRTSAFCAELARRGLTPLLEQRTGLTVNPMFAGSKMRWLLDNLPDDISLDDVCLGTIDAWLLHKLSGGSVHACDWTNASRTQLFDLARLTWDDELLGIFGIPRSALPQCRPSASMFGETVPMGSLPGGIPIGSAIGDSHGAMVGHGRLQPGAIKATYGTGSSLMSPTTALVHSAHGISSTIAWSLSQADTAYGLEGNIYATGAGVAWMAEALGLSDGGREIETMARGVADNGGVYFVPAFSGLGAPHWDDQARGMMMGITRGVRRGHLARAALEAIAYQILDVFSAIESDIGCELSLLLADGGASANDLVMQFQADILNRPVERSTSAELSALGAAYLAGISVGLWADVGAIERLPHDHQRFEPRMGAGQRDELVGGWQSAIRRVTGRN